MKKQAQIIYKKLENQREEVLQIYQKLSPSQRTFNPGPDEWNLLQVLRHLVSAELQSLAYIQKKINNKSEISETGIGSYLRNLLLKIALILPLRFKAPKIADVKDENPDFETMLSEWNTVRKELQNLIQDTDEQTLTKALYRHPRAGMLNVKQFLEFIEVHISHHQKQIKRIMKHPSFPA